MGLKQTLSFIINHPLNKKQKVKAVLRFLIWQFYARLLNPTYVHRFTPKVKLIIKKGMTGATGNLYCGLHEFNDMTFLLHFLRKEDYFLDIGANVGTYSLLASGHVGAKSIAFEPVPQTFATLKANIALNRLESKVNAKNSAIGAEQGKIKFTQGLDTMNHIATSTDQNVVEVEVNTLDAIMLENKMPTLIKIDVEGFETAVIQGSKQTLADNKLKAIIIELNGSGKRYGYDESKIHQELLDLGFKPYQYLPFKRELVELQAWGKANTIYVRDLEQVLNRLQKADPIQLRRHLF